MNNEEIKMHKDHFDFVLFIAHIEIMIIYWDFRKIYEYVEFVTPDVNTEWVSSDHWRLTLDVKRKPDNAIPEKT